uniref:HTH psq-type domain-containing protein n=1 Tax=Timema tahoe TaxID=61484 RepID=A0A7R9FLV1_9NEOP|nr:unnamed protein product [Timema tahoe]
MVGGGEGAPMLLFAPGANYSSYGSVYAVVLEESQFTLSVKSVLSMAQFHVSASATFPEVLFKHITIEKYYMMSLAAPPTLSTAWTARQSMSSKPSVTSAPLYSASKRTLPLLARVMGTCMHQWEASVSPIGQGQAAVEASVIAILIPLQSTLPPTATLRCRESTLPPTATLRCRESTLPPTATLRCRDSILPPTATLRCRDSILPLHPPPSTCPCHHGMVYTRRAGKAHRRKTLKKTSPVKQYSTRGPSYYNPDCINRTPERPHSAPTSPRVSALEICNSSPRLPLSPTTRPPPTPISPLSPEGYYVHHLATPQPAYVFSPISLPYPHPQDPRDRYLITKASRKLQFQMPFFWKPKEDGKKRTKHSPKHMLAAILSVVEENNSVRASAKTFNIDRKTLERYHNDDSDEMTEMDSDYSDPDNDLEDFEDLGLDDDYSVGDFVLVKFCGKQSVAHYAGRIAAKAFIELQQKMLETTHKLKMADVQIDGLKRSIQHAQLTDKEISSLDPDTRTYESVGRMFILTDVVEVREHLQKKAENWSDKIKTLENNKSYLERSLKDSENNIREMVQQKKDAAEGN